MADAADPVAGEGYYHLLVMRRVPRLIAAGKWWWYKHATDGWHTDEPAYVNRPQPLAADFYLPRGWFEACVTPPIAESYIGYGPVEQAYAWAAHGFARAAPGVRAAVRAATARALAEKVVDGPAVG
jgi:hypothetical protein